MAKKLCLDKPINAALEELRQQGISETNKVIKYFSDRRYSVAKDGAVLSVSTEPVIKDSYPFCDPHFDSVTIITQGPKRS